MTHMDTVKILCGQLELLAACFIFLLPLEKREAFFMRVLCETVLFITILTVIVNIGTGEAPMLTTRGSIIRFMLQTIAFSVPFFVYWAMAVALIWFCCQVSLIGAVFYGTCAYAMQHIAYALQTATSYIMCGERRWNSVDYYLIFIGIYLLIYWFFVRKIPKGGFDPGNVKQILGISIIMLVVFILFSATVDCCKGQVNDRVLIFLRIYDFSSSCFVFFVLLMQQRWFQTQQKLGVQKQMWVVREEQFQMEKKDIAIINQKCHDFKYLIAALREQPNEQHRNLSLDDLERAIINYDSRVRTGNEVLDTLLTKWAMHCEMQNIIFTCAINGEKLSFIDAVDLYVLFGNALDNAIESVLQIGNQEKRIISVTVFTKEDFAEIQIENYCEKQLHFKDGMPLTTKSDDANHGFGMKGISLVAEKYGGIVTAHLKNEIFTLNILIPIPEHK